MRALSDAAGSVVQTERTDEFGGPVRLGILGRRADGLLPERSMWRPCAFRGRTLEAFAAAVADLSRA